MPLPATAAPPAGLKRALTLVPTTAIVVAIVIGTGVFVKARVMTCNVGSPGLVLAVYALAGVLTLFGALSYAELATMMPEAGGSYNYLRAAYGRRWAFLYGWMDTLIGLGAGIAALSMLCVLFVNDLVGGTLGAGAMRLLPLGVVVLALGLNLASVKASGRVATVLTLVKVGLVLTIGVGAFVLSGGAGGLAQSGAGAACADVPASARFGLSGFGAAMIGALWSYNGWQYMMGNAGEVDNPSRTLPRALAGALAVIVVLYVFVNAAYFYALGGAGVANVAAGSSVAREVAVRLFGAVAASALAAGLMVSSFGSLSSSLLGGSRVPFAMARDGLLPQALTRVTPGTHVPRNALLLLGGIGIAFILTGTFDLLSDLVVFAVLLFQALTVAAVFVLRRTQPDAARPYRVWGYPVVPALYLFAVGFLLVNTFVATPGRALAGLGLVVLGLPVYSYYARRTPPPGALHWTGEVTAPGAPVGVPPPRS